MDAERIALEEQKVSIRREQKSTRLAAAGYNPITDEYCNGATGESLKQRDEMFSLKIQERGARVYVKGNTFNPLTGEDIN
eukprot:Clim_evm11s119 gene=Clim_evmTU11s119